MYVHEEKEPLFILNEKDWKEKLASNTGLFKKLPKPRSIIGPHIDKKDQIQGDLLAMEINYLMSKATEEQKNFFLQLMDIRHERAYEYLLTITNSIDDWKEDIQAMSYAKRFLDLKIKNVESSLSNLWKNIEIEKIEKIPSIVKKHLPEHFFDIDINERDFKQIMNNIQKSDKNAEIRCKNITDYLNKRRKEMPFLFKDIKYI